MYLIWDNLAKTSFTKPTAVILRSVSQGKSEVHQKLAQGQALPRGFTWPGQQNKEVGNRIGTLTTNSCDLLRSRLWVSSTIWELGYLHMDHQVAKKGQNIEVRNHCSVILKDLGHWWCNLPPNMLSTSRQCLKYTNKRHPKIQWSLTYI